MTNVIQCAYSLVILERRIRHEDHRANHWAAGSKLVAGAHGRGKDRRRTMSEALDRAMDNLRRAQTNLNNALEYLAIVEAQRNDASPLEMFRARRNMEHKAEEINHAALAALLVHGGGAL